MLLLQPVMTQGKLARPHPTLTAIRSHCGASVAALPEGVKRLRNALPYPVSYSGGLQALRDALETEVEVSLRPGRAT
jgi:hypothetical protein